MNMKKFILPTVLLVSLVLVGGFCNSPKAFYKKLCKVAVPFQEKLSDFYGGYSSDFMYDDVDECVEKSVEMEAKAFDSCMEEDEDQEECEEMIEDYRTELSELITRDGCEEFYTSIQCSYGSNKDECEDEVVELCEDLPKKF